MMRSLIAGCILFSGAAVSACWAEPFTINDAINYAVQSHPGVTEAAANRRATEAELRQQQGTLLPQVRLESRFGREFLNQRDQPVPPLGNDQWLHSRSHSVVVRQLLFDGFTSINQIWRQAARTDAAAARVLEHTELIALDAAEAYIEVTRFMRLIAIASDNVAAHRKILTNVRARYNGGRSGEGDLQQAEERVAAAEAALADFRVSLDEAKAKYRSAVGQEPFNLRAPGRLGSMPPSRDDALAVALKYNPTIKAAQADADAAKYDFKSTAGLFVPNVALEGRVEKGYNSDLLFGHFTDESVKVVASWDIFRGGQDLWHRSENADRYIEQTQRHARLQREAYSALDKAWGARTITSERIGALTRDVEAGRRVISVYSKEYELGQRSLIDLLNANNQLFGALVSLESTRSVSVFADYQLLAAMGQLLAYLKTSPPVEAAPLIERPFAIFPVKLPPVILHLPKPGGPEPLNVINTARSTSEPSFPPRPIIPFGERWTDISGDPAAAPFAFLLQPKAHQEDNTNVMALSFAQQSIPGLMPAAKSK